MRSLEGKKLTDAPQALLTYELCKEFGWLPSQLEQEDNKTIEELICVMNAVNEHHSKESKGQNRKELVNKYGSKARG